MNKNINKKICSEFDEVMYEFKHSSGLNVQVIPKPGFYKKYAVFAVDYGSINTWFLSGKDTKAVRTPEGIAHFLEHKLFEQEDGNVMNKFAALGASCNAATSYSRTYYYFSCASRFEECLALLVNYVLHPYLTEENVEKEKGIIAQEINMYLDDPEYVSSMNLLKLLFKNNPVRNEIAGSVDDIRAISRDMIQECHDMFYTPGRMCLTVAGDVDLKSVYDVVEANVRYNNSDKEIVTLMGKEPKSLSIRSAHEKMDTPRPIFNIGVRDDAFKYKGIDRIRREMAGSILKDMLFGLSSDFYTELYGKGIIDQSFYADYDIERDFAYFSMGGESDDPKYVLYSMRKYLKKYRIEGLDRSAFERTRAAVYGSMIKRFDFPASVSKMFAILYLQGISGFDYFTTCGKISFDDVYAVFDTLVCGDKALSVVDDKD